MTTKPIYVAPSNGAALQFSSGARGIAIRPIGKGETHSFVLLDSGRMTLMKGPRINGQGIERYIQSLGFGVAADDDPRAGRLSGLIAVHDGQKLVEESSIARGSHLQTVLAGQACTIVPFDPLQPPRQAVVAIQHGIRSIALKLSVELNSGVVTLAKRDSEPSHCADSITLDRAWIVDCNSDPASVPRNTEYGGIVELACFIVVNSGLARLGQSKTLALDQNAALGDPFPRGHIDLLLDSGDSVVVGMTAGDEFVARYLCADGDVVCERSGLECAPDGTITLALAIGCIASVIVRAHAIRDQASSKSPTRRIHRS